ncbi:homocysteine S-methyltransferase [Neodiprion lecontei]|uniref:Homocysteine S-methyltransferase n=1 Tax=Neodiprion lecontei TaxID=441921 RepID=A0A6J0C128_NEOLC|nr:homocysteine S-methyltransferase [Neodiprion lecontei]
MSLDSSKERGKVKILDGGFSTQLSVHVGNKVDGDPLWTARFLATNPDAVLATHLDFLRAGADIIQTNTYQASIGGFMKHLNLTAEESLALIKSAVDIAKEAIKIHSAETKDDRKLIVGTIGPYGAALHNGSEYTGAYDPDVTVEAIKNWHKPRLEVLVKGGVDLLAFETIPNKIEAEALVDLLRDYPAMKAWLSFSCRQDGRSLADGSNFKEVALACFVKALPGQIVAVGVNCIAPRCVSPLLAEINKDRKEDSLPLVVYPNSGERYVVSEGWQPGETTDSLENFVADWLNLGVRYIGGCCRTYAKDITLIRDAVKRWETETLK